MRFSRAEVFDGSEPGIARGRLRDHFDTRADLIDGQGWLAFEKVCHGSGSGIMERAGLWKGQA
jgi:hypothetical protein